MRRIVTLISALLFCICVCRVKAQDGLHQTSAINAGTYGSGAGSFSYFYNTANSVEDYQNAYSVAWYSFTLTGTSDVHISLCGSNYDTYIYLLSGNTVIGVDDDSQDCGLQSVLNVTGLSPGTYYIAAGGYNGSMGNQTIALAIQGIGQPPCISYSSPAAFTAGTAISNLTPGNTCGAVVTGVTSSFATGFYQPLGTAVDASGNVYVADAGTHTIYKQSADGTTRTVLAGAGYAGFVNGNGPSAQFYHPLGMAIDASGNVYVADEDNHAIRKIDPYGNVSTYAGTGYQGTANGYRTSASFYYPCGVAVDAAGNVYVADSFNNLIRKIDASGYVTTLAGTGAAGFQDGNGSSAMFSQPFNIALDASGNLYVTDRAGHRVRRVTPAGMVSTVAGSGSPGYANGNGIAASFNGPTGITLDKQNNIYITENNRVRRIDPAGNVTTLAGTGVAGLTNGDGSAAMFNYMFGININKNTGALYLAELSNSDIRKVLSAAYSITPDLPAGLTLDGITGTISGTPTAVTLSTAYTVTASNASGSSSASINITVNPGAICAQMVAVPSQDKNYVATYTPRVALNNSSDIATNACDVMQTIQYFDGLGRPLQTVQVKGSPNRNDIVQPVAYDQFGRETAKYMPYTTSYGQPGAYRPTALTDNTGNYGGSDQYNFYHPPGTSYNITQLNNNVAHIPTPYAITAFEPSPLNRAIEQGAPGDAWQLTGTVNTSGTLSGHTVKMVYLCNNTTALSDTANSLAVPLYAATINSDQSRTLVWDNTTTYGAGQLYVNVTKDENWKSGRGGTTEEYKDKEGHVILKRTYNYTAGTLQRLSTYYVYDDFGNLAFVLPPAAKADSALSDQTTLDNLCYQYRYDERQRLIQKRIPGKGWDWMVYNQLDQLVLIQDLEERDGNNEWKVTKYDGLGRVIMTCLWNDGNRLTQTQLQSNIYASAQFDIAATDNSTAYGYTMSSYPSTLTNTPLTINFYDGYAHIPSVYFQYFTSIPTSASTMTRGLLTATATNVLPTSGLLFGIHYYDDLGRNIQNWQQHYYNTVIGGANYDVVTNSYNFSNQLTYTTRKHYNSSNNNTNLPGAAPIVTIANQYLYDNTGRKLKTWETINNGTSTSGTRTLISQIQYNEVGQVMAKHLHSTDSVSFLQDINYTYNERGWLNQSSAQLFEEQLQYNKVNNITGITPTAQFNGNIASQSWGLGATPNSSSFTYKYDELNRLTSGVSADGKFSERGITYDVMGNIQTLSRVYNNVLIDSLNYAYTGNRLQSVYDKAPDTGPIGYKTGNYTYGYSLNGNMTVDNSKGLGISYNLLDLPYQIFGNKTITYYYDANGQKLRRESTGSGNTDYVAGIQYDGTTTRSLTFILTEEGKAVPNGSTYNYNYYLTDHLGNTRVSFDSQSTTATALQTDDYLPFGLEINTSTNGTKNEYLYNKKELQEELTLYDYGARFYDPVIGRFTSVDPMAEVSRRWSTYAYSYNNPTRFTDVDGMIPGDFLNDDGKKIGSDGKNDGKVYVVKTTETDFDSKAPADGITKDQRKATEKFIKDNNGNTSAFEANDIAYKNSVEIEGSSSSRQAMVDVVNKDNGKGGTADANNREHGGSVSNNGTVAAAPDGAVAKPGAPVANISIPTDANTKSLFHSHESASVTTTTGGSSGSTISFSSSSSTVGFAQAPSSGPGLDINSTNTPRTNYVFGRGNGTVYIYNSNSGVQATIPQKYFVTPKQ